jgi:hypothetical protein
MDRFAYPLMSTQPSQKHETLSSAAEVVKLFVDFISIAYLRRPESLSQFSDSLRAGRFGVRIREEAEIFSTHPD